MSVLIDTSVWVEYFRNSNNCEPLEVLIDENLVATNDLVLAEIIPYLKIRKQRTIIKLLSSINNLSMAINWDQIMDFQYECLKNGINGIGIPDLIIAQNAKQNNCPIYSLDKHFIALKNVVNIELFV
ncbi:MAG: PIN domain-containing protein [Deltaproteobacteria bacterium]|nr:PIN domain-containing protein [Candidatus Tharpellaceae bacterium]